MIEDGNDMQPPSIDDERLDARERAFVATLRAPLSERAGFDARVMTAVRREPLHGVRAHAQASRAIAPFVAAFAGIAAAVMVLVLGHEGSVSRHDARTAGAVATPVRHAAIQNANRTVRFTLVASGASRVNVAGSFNGWNTAATPLRRVANDTWAADVPLGAGRYVYQFVVDGHRWVPDPHAPHDAGDDFGATNSVVTVATSGSA